MIDCLGKRVEHGGVEADGEFVERDSLDADELRGAR